MARVTEVAPTKAEHESYVEELASLPDDDQIARFRQMGLRDDGKGNCAECGILATPYELAYFSEVGSWYCYQHGPRAKGDVGAEAKTGLRD